MTLIRSAIRGLLGVADEKLAGEVRQALLRDDDYSTAGKPACDWEDKAAREALIDALARDAHAALLARRRPVASTATRGTSPSTRTRNSSPRPR